MPSYKNFYFQLYMHKSGKLHTNADALSRLVVHNQSTNPLKNNSNCAISLNPTVC